MRIRPLAALSVAALSALVLAGCSAAQDAEPTPSASGAVDLCDAQVASGSASESITVEGEPGELSTAAFETPLEINELQSTPIVEAEGDPLENGQYVNFALSAFSAETGEELGALGYTPGEILPQPISAATPVGQIAGCAAPGSRFVATFPATDQAPGQVYVLDILSVTPTSAWGEEQEPVDGMPAVELADDGTPSVEIPSGDAPSEIQIEVLKKGDGITVEPGDTTLLQYYGVDWETGESFDASWTNGAPYSLSGNQYVPGFVQALEGQAVGSQVLVVIPPALAYGEEGSSDHELAGKTLVFVIDILATQHAAQQ
ncbi:FKBP-type peptidyl-prolyl cis-trans isomerase [Microbacterium hibisci]|uniref:FKBP-type peptidyl-prolyl cis-trans isomerase n=1 Tax=Microbacterium hibisci TaxID=2036000 RepID=UPI00194211D2|nr:FKBP-type peptidyl-prolyl cis-trans isomerase [Microbacterium hibisci]